MTRRIVVPTLVAVLLVGLGQLWTTAVRHPVLIAAAAPTATPSNSPYTIKDPNLFIYVPSNAAQRQPLQVLVAMHGMGGDGGTFCQNLLPTAERNGWIVVAPTVTYHDYKNPDLVVQDDTTYLPQLRSLLDRLPERTGLVVRQKVLLYGHSRGGQAVHRFATDYPDRVLAVAALSSGSYTLPLQTILVNGRSQTLPMPYGVADMRQRIGQDFNYAAFKQVVFRIEVGGQDTNASDTPRAWDPYLGQTRLDRARTYTRVLQDLGLNATLAIYPDAGHAVTPKMRDDALAFLQGVTESNASHYGSGLVRGVRSVNAIVTATARP